MQGCFVSPFDCFGTSCHIFTNISSYDSSNFILIAVYINTTGMNVFYVPSLPSCIFMYFYFDSGTLVFALISSRSSKYRKYSFISKSYTVKRLFIFRFSYFSVFQIRIIVFTKFQADNYYIQSI